VGISQQIGASSLIKPGVIDNTAARPASPYEGQVIYQKDTDEILVYNGTAWTRPANMPWGVAGYQNLTSVFNTTAPHTTSQDTGMTLNYVTNTSRIYKATININPYPSGGLNTMIFSLLQNGVTINVFNLSSSALDAGNSLAMALSCFFIPTTNASSTYKVQLKGTSNTQVSDYSTSTAPRQFWIEDIGPA
jgi:hypothetical protein